MVNPANCILDTNNGERLITIEPVYEEITGGDLFLTGRYILTEPGGGTGEIRFVGESVEWEWNGDKDIPDDNISHIVNFIREYNEPELAGYLD